MGRFSISCFQYDAATQNFLSAKRGVSPNRLRIKCLNAYSRAQVAKTGLIVPRPSTSAKIR